MRASLRATTIIAGIATTVGALSGAFAGEPKVLTGDTAQLSLGQAVFDGGKTLDLAIGIGSAAFHGKDDPANVIWTLSDRGPNIDCGEVEEITGLGADQLCGGEKAGKVFPTPEFTPSIFKVELGDDGTFHVAERVKLLDRDGKPITGLSNPLTLTKTELAFDTSGAALTLDANGVDTEGLVMDSAAIPGLPAKIEGVALMGGDDVVLINDDDFGIAGAKTSIIQLDLPLTTTN